MLEKSDKDDKNELSQEEQVLIRNAREVLLASLEAWDWERKQRKLKKVLDNLGLES